jgi:undecaprenyl-diphosphatase
MRSQFVRLLRTIWEWIRRHPLIALALIIAGAAVDAFFELAEELHEEELGPFDIYVKQYVLRMQSDNLFLFSKMMTDLLVLPYVILLVFPFFLYLLFTRRYVLAGGIMVIPGLAGLIIVLLKAIYQRPRPMEPLLPASGYSFPSGHAFSAMVIYGLLGYVVWRCFSRRRWQRALIVIVVLLLVLATGYARVYLGAHFTSDVVGGWIGGLAVLCGGIALLEVLQRRWK